MKAKKGILCVYCRYVKRFLDIFFSAVLILMLMPIMIIISMIMIFIIVIGNIIVVENN